MRRRSELLACVALAGCNTVFGLERGVPWDAPVDDGRLPADRDRDGIVDRDDPCIASITDFKSDLDFDGNPNETDHCPADFDTFDSDGDQIFDDCDPLPQFDNDRRRCFMSFPNPTLTRELWLPRGDATVWELVTFSSIVATGNGTLLAQESFEAQPTTSYDLLMSVAQSSPPMAAATLWLRTNEVAAPSDIGCEARAEGTATRITIKGTEPPISRLAPHGYATLFRIQASISAAATAGSRNVRCAARFSGSIYEQFDAAAELVLPAGRVAFGAEGTRTIFIALTVLERDDVPQL